MKVVLMREREINLVAKNGGVGMLGGILMGWGEEGNFEDYGNVARLAKAG